MNIVLEWDGTNLSLLAMALNERETSQLRAALQEAVVKCSERCLYQSAKWYEAQSQFELPC